MPDAAVVMSVKVAADWISPTPLVLHAATVAPMGAKVTRPFIVVVWVTPLVGEPIAIVPIEPDAPAVPMLMVLVLPEDVAPD